MLHELLHGLIAQSAEAPSSPSLFSTFGWVPLVFVAMYFLIIRPQQQQQKKQQDYLSKLKKGDEVVLQSGIFGKVFEVRPDDIMVELAPNVKVRVLKSAVQAVPVPAAKPEPKGSEAEKKS